VAVEELASHLLIQLVEMKPVPITSFNNFIPAVLLLFKNRLATGCDNSGDITKRSEVVFAGLLACAYL
jgi:hypothetical protein